jgi:aminoglycoside phosphotransferase (APT) family kinase protein
VGNDGRQGKLIGRGRHADVFEVGPTRVLRRYRTGQDAQPEATVMAHVRAHGYPAPEVFAVDGSSMELERVVGPSLLHVMARQPHRLPRWARLLAELHDQLHQITALEEMARPFGHGDQVLHLDLHPANVVITRTGPIVLDWGFAAAGPPQMENAHTWLQLETSQVPGSPLLRLAGTIGRRLLIRQFLDGQDLAPLRAVLPEVAAYRLAVRELTAGERASIPSFVGRAANAG